MVEPAIVCHGGAGHSAKDQPGVDLAVEAGWAVLMGAGQGGSDGLADSSGSDGPGGSSGSSGSSGAGGALEAAIAAIVIMENDPVLNAGTGGRIRADGSVQLDASVMTSDGRFGAVSCLEDTPNPIHVAAALLDDQVNMLAGLGARKFADSLGIGRTPVVGSPLPTGNDTVGAVVRDSSGLIVVACSTGGCTGRPAGRIGDTPLIGAGLWCDENIGVAATGIGEAITLKMSCVRIADNFRNSIVDAPISTSAMDSLGTDLLKTAIDWGVAQFHPSVEAGFIGLGKSGGGVGISNTKMPVAFRSFSDES